MKLKPKKFKNHTTILKGSPGKNFPKKIPVHVARQQGAYISRWIIPSFWERLKFLFGLTSIWLVLYTKGHPPVYLTCENEKAVFQKEDDDDM